MLRRSPLFTAIVVAGAAVGAACGDETIPPASTDAGVEGGGAPDAGGAGVDAAADARDTEDAEAPRKDAGLCPPGSDRPFPPCNLIK